MVGLHPAFLFLFLLFLLLLFLLLLYAKLLYMTRRKIGLAGTILKRRSVSRKITARELTKSRTEIFEITLRDFLNHGASLFLCFGIACLEVKARWVG